MRVKYAMSGVDFDIWSRAATERRNFKHSLLFIVIKINPTKIINECDHRVITLEGFWYLRGRCWRSDYPCRHTRSRMPEVPRSRERSTEEARWSPECSEGCTPCLRISHCKKNN